MLNEDEAILVLVDEAHRSQAGDLQATLLAGLPNCARIGFTGTPILMGDKKRTHEIFGEFIDRYTIREAEADGAIVPILYEGRTAHGAVKDGANLDDLFEDLFREHTPEELEAIKAKYATKGQIFEAPDLIRDKARDMLRHYVTNILPNGFKAQVVAYSRLAVVRYLDAFIAARDELLAEAEALSPEDKALDDEALCTRPPAVQAQVQAWRWREVLAPDRVRAHHLGQQQRRPGLEAVDRRRRAGAAHQALQAAAAARRPGQGRPAGLPDREVDAADRLRRADRGRDVPGPADPRGRAAADHRPREPHRPRQDSSASWWTTTGWRTT